MNGPKQTSGPNGPNGPNGPKNQLQFQNMKTHVIGLIRVLMYHFTPSFSCFFRVLNSSVRFGPPILVDFCKIFNIPDRRTERTVADTIMYPCARAPVACARVI